MPTNVFFSPKVRTEQNLYEDLVIESLKMYGQDVYYIPRSAISKDEILNEEYSRFEEAYTIELYIPNVEGFGGEGNLLSKFGLQIRDQATFIISKKRFSQLVSLDSNVIASERPREGDLIYLPLSKSLFEIKFVEHEKPFYQLSHFVIYELECELFEYSAEQFETGIDDVDIFESINGSQSVFEIYGGSKGFSIGEKVSQMVDGVEVYGEVSKFIETSPEDPIEGTLRRADIYLTQIHASDGSFAFFVVDEPIQSIDHPDNDSWVITNLYDIRDLDKGLPHDPRAQNEVFEVKGAEIVDWTEGNPFGEPRVKSK
jgi:hypothetical protein